MPFENAKNARMIARAWRSGHEFEPEKEWDAFCSGAFTVVHGSLEKYAQRRLGAVLR